MGDKEIKTKNHLKKDLITVIVLAVLFCGVLIGLKILDEQGGKITEFAGKITSYFIR